MNLPPQRKKNILSKLRELYPNPRSELNFSNDFELVSAVLLSAQCTDKKVNQVTPALFSKYPTFEMLSKAPLAKVEEIIRPINYYRTKSKNLIGMASRVVTNFQGALPKNHEDLISLPGVGNKTANVVLSELKIAHTFPVDTHVFRVSKRLGFSDGKDVVAVEEDLKKLFPPEQWRELHHWLIFHGRRVCVARNPKCGECVLRTLCPSALD